MTDAERVERLARLQQRRLPAADTSPPVTAELPFLPPAVAAPATGRHERSRRRSPASTAKIVTVGASTTAVLGMMAGYGMADRAAAMKPTLGPADEAAATAPATMPATVPAASPTETPATVAAPDVIVVVIDAATGRTVSVSRQNPGDAGFVVPTQPQPAPGTAAVPGSAPAADPGTVAPTKPAPTPTAAPVAAPTAVDLAVPAPPAPAPAPAAAPPAPAPQPQASSGGS